MKTLVFEDDEFFIQRDNLVNGIYFFTITDSQQQMLFSGKLIVD